MMKNGRNLLPIQMDFLKNRNNNQLMKCQYLAFTNQTYKGIYLFHVYSHQISFKKFDRYIVAASALFLAGKLSDTPRQIEKFVIQYLFLMNQRKQAKNKSQIEIKQFNKEKFEEFQSSLTEESIKTTKDKIIEAEQQHLNLLGFDLEMLLPYQYVDKLLTAINKNQNQQWIEQVFRTINETFKSKLCLRFHPLWIAISAIQIAASILQFPLDINWYNKFLKNLSVSSKQIQLLNSHMKKLLKINY